MKINQTTSINLIRKNGGQVLPVVVAQEGTINYRQIRPTLLGVPAYVEETNQGPALAITADDVKKHLQVIESFLGAKIPARQGAKILLVSAEPYHTAAAEFEARIAAMKADHAARASVQPVRYVAYDFLDWGDYSINQEREIQEWRPGLPEYGEAKWMRGRCWSFWNTNIGDRQEAWKALLEASPVSEIRADLRDISPETAGEWIAWTTGENERRAEEKVKKEAAAIEAEQRRLQEKAKLMKEVEENELMIFASAAIYSSASNMMLHSIGCKVGDQIEVYTTAYASDMKRAGKAHTTTYDARQELAAAGFTWNAEGRIWTAPYTEERWAVALPIIRKYDTKFWPSDLGMVRCWECGTYGHRSKMREDGPGYYCGC